MTAPAPAPTPDVPLRLSWPVVIGLSASWVLVCAVFALQVSAVGLLPWEQAFRLSLFDWGPWIVLTPVTLWLAQRLPITPRTWRWSVPTHLLTAFLLLAITEGTMSALAIRRERLLPPPPDEARPTDAATRPAPPPDEQSGPPALRRGFRGPNNGPMRDPVTFALFRLFDRARISLPVYLMLVAGAHAAAQYRRGVERERRVLQAEARLAEARLLALQAQLNPHFLFNTLNTISHLVFANPQAAEDMIAALSDLLRSVLAVQHRPQVSLQEEMSFIRHYTDIQKMRFSDQITFNVDIGPGVQEAKLPTLLLQPLVENAIIHGITPHARQGAIHIRAAREGDQLVLRVADSGTGKVPAPETVGTALQFREGIGLRNTRERLAALYGAQHTFHVTRATEGGVAFRIAIPFRTTAP